MEPGAIQISHSNTIDQNFQAEEKFRRQQEIDLPVARQNFQDTMQSTLFSRISFSSYQSDDNSIYNPMNCSFGSMNETLDENDNVFSTVED